MNEVEEGTQRRRRGIYLLPNIFTTLTLFGGFYAIVAAMNGKFSQAAVAIGAAMVADSLDGLVARWTRTASDFGKEYDSLCDMVAFGVAASIVMYTFSLQHLAEYEWLGGKLGWMTAFAYTTCAALRLARFNVLAVRGGAKGAFFGLPSPAAAGLLVGFVWAFNEHGAWKGESLVVPAVILTWFAAVMMVSNFRYLSLKQLRLRDRVPFRYFVVALGVAVLFLMFPTHWVMFLGFLAYALSGPAMALWRRFRREPAAPAPAENREPPSL